MRPSESGDSGISAVFGVALFLGFLLLASQVLLHLYATSTVTAVAFDAARRAAAAGPEGAERDRCRVEAARARASLGTWGSTASVSCDHRDGEFVTVTVRGASPAAGLRIFEDVFERRIIQRSASVRREGLPR